MTKAEELKAWFAEHIGELKTAGIQSITASHHGEGDEGDFDGIDINGQFEEGAAAKLPEGAAELIEAAAEELAGGTFSWNDYPGGGGDMTLLVDEGTITYVGYSYEEVRNEDQPVVL